MDHFVTSTGYIVFVVHEYCMISVNITDQSDIADFEANYKV